MKYIHLVAITILMFLSCEKNETNPSLDEFCSIAPDGWSCDIITKDFSETDIPKNAPQPMAIIKYTNPGKSFATYLEKTNSPSLTLDFYPISQKQELIDLIKSQQMYSWCIPMYYGETKKYFILTSPCFINGGSFTESANSSIEDLHNALKSIITVNNYID